MKPKSRYLLPLLNKNIDGDEHEDCNIDDNDENDDDIYENHINNNYDSSIHCYYNFCNNATTTAAANN